MLANDVQETPAKGRHLLDGSPFGYDAHKGETQRTHNPLVAGSIPAGPTAISAGQVLYSDFPGRGADDRRRGHRTSTRSPCPRETRASPRRRRRSSATTLRPSLLPLLRAGRGRSDGLRQQLVQLLLILSAESGKR